MTITRKKKENNGITISCFFVWQFMMHSMICISGQPGIKNDKAWAKIIRFDKKFKRSFSPCQGCDKPAK